MRILKSQSRCYFAPAILACLALAFSCFLPSSDALSQEAKKQESSDVFYWRVLTLPKAVLREAPSQTASAIQAEVPAFTVYYVYESKSAGGENWIRVGTRPRDSADGWIRREESEDWRSMQVMQFASRGRRERVMFFKQKTALQEIVARADAAKAEQLMADVVAGNADRNVLASIESDGAIITADKPYLMPIFERQELPFGNETSELASLLSVGGLNLEQQQPDESQVPGTGAEGDADGLSEFRIGVAFVIDTTLSMGAYIEETREAVRAIYRQLEEQGTLEKVSFALVGYRDDTVYDPLIEYVTKIYQPFDRSASPDTILANLEKAKPSSVPTQGWNEDAYAGLTTAIEELKWDEFNARVIVLISDAGAREGVDTRAQHQNLDARIVAETARQNRIAIIPVHLRTAQAQGAHNIEGTESQFRGLGQTGDENEGKYLGIEGGSVEQFADQMGRATEAVSRALVQAANGQRVSNPDEESSDDEPSLESFLVNEIFRSQLEYLGAEGDEVAPRFYRAWAADRDLVHPTRTALVPAVFLTRGQLSNLARSLTDIVDRAEEGDVEQEEFFDLLQSLAATTSLDPTQGQSRDFQTLGESGLLPAFLDELSYTSDLLNLTEDDWNSMSPSELVELISELKFKLRIYSKYSANNSNWIDLGAQDPSLEVFPVPFEYLP